MFWFMWTSFRIYRRKQIPWRLIPREDLPSLTFISGQVTEICRPTYLICGRKLGWIDFIRTVLSMKEIWDKLHAESCKESRGGGHVAWAEIPTQLTLNLDTFQHFDSSSEYFPVCFSFCSVYTLCEISARVAGCSSCFSESQNYFRLWVKQGKNIGLASRMCLEPPVWRDLPTFIP